MPDWSLGTAQSWTSAAAAGLVYVSDSMPGLRRVRRGKGFAYLLPDGHKLSDGAEIDRIARLAIPPAYEDVWICRDPRGHLQATGRDARGRKQYRYHPRWRVFRDAEKFERMPSFAEALPRLRRRLRRDVALRGMPRDKVLAIVVSLLDATRVRIGNAEYARNNDSYGLTTLRNRHVEFVCDGKLLLRFAGKGGTDHEIAVGDRKLARLVRRCHELPGQRLFQYVDDIGEPHPIDSDQVNSYLKEAMGDDFTAKDFRTWNATLRAMEIMRATPLPDPVSERALAGLIAEAVKHVAADLGNTPAVCRKSYINPLVFDAWRSGALHDGLGEEIVGAPRKAERLVAAFLRRKAESATKDRTGRAKKPFKASGEAVGRVRPWRDNRSAAG
ncbi:MAG: DNA topoisomerase IB [Betaproteobacteria bacterium]|nr:MAG: DNA topoisomerase IB [Betaproteobacteria bacterium]